MADKITNEMTLLFKTKLDEKSKQEVGKNLKSLLENAAIGFDEAETKRNLEPIIRMMKKLFDKAEIAFDADQLLAMPSRQALQKMAEMEVDQLQMAFDKALAKSGGIKIDFGDMDLSAMTEPLEKLTQELSEIGERVASTTKKSIREIENTLTSLSKTKNLDKTVGHIEKTLEAVNNPKHYTSQNSATKALGSARDDYIKSVENNDPWEKQYQYLLTFVSRYEAMTKKVKPLVDENRPEFKQLYELLSPKAGAVKISLEHLVDLRQGNELREYKNQPWARETTLKQIRDSLKNGITVKEGSGNGGGLSDDATPPWEDNHEDSKPKKPNTKAPVVEVPNVEAEKQARIETEKKAQAEVEAARAAEQRRIEEEKIAVAAKKIKIYRGVVPPEDEDLTRREILDNGDGSEWWATNKNAAQTYADMDEGGAILVGTISPKNPLIINAGGRNYDDFENMPGIQDIAEQFPELKKLVDSKADITDVQKYINTRAKELGHDAVQFENVNDVLNPSAFKELGDTFAVLDDNILEVNSAFAQLEYDFKEGLGDYTEKASKDNIPDYYKPPIATPNVQDEVVVHKEKTAAIVSETQAVEQLNDKLREKDVIENSDNDNAEVAETNAATEAVNRENEALKENISLKTQANSQDVDIAPKSEPISEETNVSGKSVEVKTSIDTEELRNLLSAITYNVKVVQDAEPTEDNKISIDEAALESVLNRITYNVKIAHDDADKTANKIAIDEGALEGTLKRVFANILNPAGQSGYSAMSREDATGYISEHYDHKMWDNWYSKSIDEFRTQIAVALENDTNMRNAALNQMWDEYRHLTGKDIGFNEFLHTKIPLYRGEPLNSQSQSERALSFSLTPSTAEEFGERVLRVWMRPIDTLGMANPTYIHQPEAEVMVPKTAVPEYDKWRESLITESASESNIVDAPWAREDTLTAVKGVLEQIQANTTKSETVEVAPASTEVGNVLATENTLAAIKTAVEAINKKVVKGTKAKTSEGGSKKKAGVGKKNAGNYAGSQYFTEKLKTQTMQLAKFRAQLMTTGKLTDDVDAQIYELLDALAQVKSGPDFSEWSQKFQQLKTSVGITDIFDKAEGKDVAASYQQLIEFQKTRNKLELQYEKAQDGSALKQFYAEQLTQIDNVIARQKEMLENEEYEAKLAKIREEQARKLGEVEAKAADKVAKKAASDQKKLDKRRAMTGKAGSAIGRAESVWLEAEGLEQAKLPEGFKKQVSEYYDALDKLRLKHHEVNTSEVVTDEQQNELIKQTAEVNRLTEDIGGLVAEYQKLSGSNVDETKTQSTTLTSKSPLSDYEAQLKQYAKSITDGKAQIKSFNAETKTLTYTVKTGKNEFTEYTAAVRNLDHQMVSVQGTTKRTETFLEATARKMRELTSYFSGMAIFNRIGQELRRGIQYIREIDLALTELKKVTDETEETYDKFLDTAAKTGARLGTTISAVTEATATFAKLGYTMEQATEMAESAIVYKNVGDNIESTEDAADSIISTMKGFRLEASEAMRIVDSFNEVGNRFAITSRGIGEALRLSASALSEGGNSLDESIGLITAANEVVNDPSSVGTALKTLTLRLRGSKIELEEMGEDVSDMATTTSQLQAKLLALTGGQVDIMLDENTFKNSTQILREMAEAWEDMTDIQRASALELMGGRLLPLCIEICA